MLDDDVPPVAAPVPRTRGRSRRNTTRDPIGQTESQAGTPAERLGPQEVGGALRFGHGQRRLQAVQQFVDMDGRLDACTPRYDARSQPLPQPLAACPVSRPSTGPVVFDKAAAPLLRGKPGSPVGSLPAFHPKQLSHPAGVALPMAAMTTQPSTQGSSTPGVPEPHSNVQKGTPGTAASQENPHRVGPGFGEGDHTKQRERSQQSSKEALHVHLGRLLRAVLALSFLIIRQVHEVAVVCLWQLARTTLGLLKELCCRCSVGLHAAAAGLIHKVHTGRGRPAIAVDALAKLLQRWETFLKRSAASASAAASRATAETVAARASAVSTAAAVGSKWKSMTSGAQAAAHVVADSLAPDTRDARAKCDRRCEDGSIELTHEEALATACDLWASVHGEYPSKRIGVLQFQERLRERLTARDGSLYLLPEKPEDQGTARHEQATSSTFLDPQQQTDLKEQGKSAEHAPASPLGRAAKSIEKACRSAFMMLATLLSVLTQHSQQQQQQREGTRKQYTELASRSSVAKLSSRTVIFIKVLLQELGIAYGFATAATKTLTTSAGDTVMWAMRQTCHACSTANLSALLRHVRAAINAPVEVTQFIVASASAVSQTFWHRGQKKIVYPRDNRFIAREGVTELSPGAPPEPEPALPN